MAVLLASPGSHYLSGLFGKGDTRSFTWRPGDGLEVAMDGKVRGTVLGEDFAQTLFTVWFRPEPGDENLKRGMLGK